MTEKSRNTLLLIGGGYLVYTGGNLNIKVLESHPENETMFLVFGVLFVLFGLLVAAINVRALWLRYKDGKSQTPVTNLSEEPVQTSFPNMVELKLAEESRMDEEPEEVVEELEDSEVIEDVEDTEETDEFKEFEIEKI